MISIQNFLFVSYGVSLCSSYSVEQGICWHLLVSICLNYFSCLPDHEKHNYFLIWEHVVSAHGTATALNIESLGVLFCFFFIYSFYILLFMKSIKISCLGACCVISLGIYGPKQGIHWHIFCYSLFILILCLPVHEKNKYILVWEHVVWDHGAAMELNRKSLGIWFVYLCLY